MFATSAVGFTLDMPRSAELVSSTQEDGSFYDLPTAPWNGDALPATQIMGSKLREIWQIHTPGLTTAQAIAPLMAQLAASGYEQLFNCETRQCGGFDYRFHTDIADSKEIQVNLGDFRAYSAAKDAANGVNIFASRTPDKVFLQVTFIGNTNSVPELKRNGTEIVTPVRNTQIASPATPEGSLAERLFETGHAVLSGVVFASGATTLEGEDPESLQQLASLMKDNPTLMVAIVGHTDSQGSLEGNIAISKARARAVMQRLVQEYGIASTRLSGEGMGYLAPLSSNLSDGGRALNRRVEAIVLSVE